MRKQFLIIGIAFLLGACSNQESTELTSESLSMNQTTGNIRSYEEALNIAQSAITMLEGQNATTRADGNSRRIDLSSSSKVAKLDTKTRSDANINDTLIYVINYENDEGFALVSASRHTVPLLAVTEKGHCDPDIPSEVEGFNVFMNMAKEYVRLEETASLMSTMETKDSIVGCILTQEIGPYISVRWGQSYPEGEFCPNGIAGCANTALAQIMSYYEYPTTINLTYNNSGNLSLNWTNIKQHATLHTLGSCSTPNTHTSISHLLRQLGHLNNSGYVNEYDGELKYTITDEVDIKNTVTNLGYYQSTTLTSYDGPYARNQLDNGRLIYMCGFGHYWVLDGYATGVAVHNVMYKNGNQWIYTGQTYTTDNYFNHFNWGWYGVSNGYYCENVYDSWKSVRLDSGCSQTSNEYDPGYFIHMFSVYH